MENVSKIMARNILYVLQGSSIDSAAKEMDKKGVGLLLVTNLSKLVGVLSERDILKRVVSRGLSPKDVSVSEIMTKDPITAMGDTSIRDAWKIMEENHFRHLPIVNKSQKPVGIVSARDILKFLAKNKNKYNDFFEELKRAHSDDTEFFST